MVEIKKGCKPVLFKFTPKHWSRVLFRNKKAYQFFDLFWLDLFSNTVVYLCINFVSMRYTPILGPFWMTTGLRTENISKGCCSIHSYLDSKKYLLNIASVHLILISQACFGFTCKRLVLKGSGKLEKSWPYTALVSMQNIVFHLESNMI